MGGDVAEDAVEVDRRPPADLALAEIEEIALRARREVVEGEDLPALVEQQLGQMGAYEAGNARDESRPVHRRRSLYNLNEPETNRVRRRKEITEPLQLSPCGWMDSGAL